MSTATAPLAGRSRGERLKSLAQTLWRRYGPIVAGAPGSRERRAWWRFAIIIPVANFCGAVDLFVFLWYVLPLPSVPDQQHVQHVNAIAFVTTLVVTFAACSAKGRAHLRPVARWINSGQPADEAMVRRVLRLPLHSTLICASAWLASALTFAVLDSFYSVTLGLLLAVAIALGGLTTCATMYLLTEKVLHPITVRALRSAVPHKPAVPGVDARVLLSFGSTTAGPLLAMVALGIVVLSGQPVDNDRLELTIYDL